ETRRPVALERRHLLPHARPHGELDAVPLPVAESDRFDAGEPLERPGEADGRILPAGEKDERGVGGNRCHDHPASWPGIAVRRTASLRSPMSRPSTHFLMLMP